jgi:hypothetical protein
MKRAGLFASIIMFGSATLVYAERNLIPTLDNQTDVCLEQPAEPVWMQDIDMRNSYKRLLVQQIYRAQSMQRIVAAQDCACPTRYPSWKAAETIFFESFGTAEYWDVVEATSDYRRLANEFRIEAMPICEEAGNW